MNLPIIHNDLPKHVAKVVAPLVEKHIGLLPTWCHTLSIVMTDEPVRAACDSKPEYREASLLIGGFFMVDTDEERENTIVHEFLHVTLSPLDQLAFTLAPTEEDNPEASKMAFESIRRALEGCVCDLMRVMGHFGRSAPDTPEQLLTDPTKR